MSDELNEFSGNGEQMPPPKSSNKAFIIAASVLGGLFLLILLAIAVYVAVGVPSLARQRAARSTQIAQINSANTATVAALTKIAVSVKLTQQAPTATPLPTATNTITLTPIKASPTSVVAQATSTNTVAAGPIDTRTATVAALLTQAAQAKLTLTYLPTSTALPKTGSFEDVGIPSLVGLTLLLLVVIFLVRRMRATPAH